MDDFLPEDVLYRRVFSYFIRDDGRISSVAFMTRSKKPDPSISVHLARITSAEQCLALGGVPGLGVIALRAAGAFDLGLRVIRDPQPGDPGHCLIEGTTAKQQCVELARASWIVIPPTGRLG